MSEEDRIASLTKFERLLLVNQLKILERLYPEEATYYASHRMAIEKGYTLHYESLFEHLFPELSMDDSREVLEILDMYRAITLSHEKLPELERVGIDDMWLKFKGFDGNHDGARLGYVHYFIVGLNRYPELRYGQADPDFNSHMDILAKYRAMLEEWRRCKNRHRLTKDELARVLSAGNAPAGRPPAT